MKCSRIGAKKSNGSGRPIKVTLQSPEEVTEVLRRAKDLKSIVAPDFSFSFKKLYLSPDRTEEQRKSRRNLVLQMKQKIEKDPGKRYYIKDNRVCVADP